MPTIRGPIAIGILCVGALVSLFWLRVDNRHDRLLQQHTPAARAYEEFKKEFGNDEVAIVAISGKPLFEFESLDEMVLAADRFAKLPHVKSVNGIPILFRENFGEEDNEALEEEVTSTPFYQGLFISADHKTAGILLELDAVNEPGVPEKFTQALTEAVQPLKDFGFRVDLVGDPIFQSTMDHLTQSESLRMFPIAAGISLIVLIVLLRSIKATLVVLLCSAVTLLLTIGTMVVTGHTLNLVTASSPLILWVLSLSNCIHIVSRYQRMLLTEDGPVTAIQKTMRELTYSCALSSVTTAFGFVSLAVARVSAVQELGIYMGIGMIISMAVSFALAPWLLVKWKIAPAGHVTRDSRLLEQLGHVLTRHHVPALVVSGVFVVISVYYALQVKANPDSLDFLQKENPVAQSVRYVADHLTGLQSLELVVDTPGGWTNLDYWPAIEKAIEDVEAVPNVARVYSPLDFIKKINQWDHELDPEYYALPETREETDRLLGLLTDEDRKQMDRFATSDASKIRLSALMNSTNSKEFDDAINASIAAADRLPSPLSGHVTGMASRMHEFEYGLITTQISSYMASFLMVFGSILIGLRSLRLTLLSIPPNVLPTLSVFTAMGAAQISLNVATVMVASISLGIAVDNTVHLLANYRRLRAEGNRGYASIHHTLAQVGPACVVTTVTACIGFFTLSMSEFIPISNFGMLAGIAMIVALVADLVVVPSVLAFAGD